MMNRLANAHNQFQKEYKRVLCVCSAGLLRSPTAALVLSQEPYNFNTRAVGFVKEYALIPVDMILLSWADEIVCMEAWQADGILEKLGDSHKPVISLGIEDNFPYRDPELMRRIREQYDAQTKTA